MTLKGETTSSGGVRPTADGIIIRAATASTRRTIGHIVRTPRGTIGSVGIMASRGSVMSGVAILVAAEVGKAGAGVVGMRVAPLEAVAGTSGREGIGGRGRGGRGCGRR